MTEKWKRRIAKSYTHSRLGEDKLISNLVSPQCVATVVIEGNQCNSLLNSGSQVTTVSQSFYETHLSSQPILSLNSILEVDGAGGQVVPYLGYIEINIFFPENVAGKPETVNTLALVVPD